MEIEKETFFRMLISNVECREIGECQSWDKAIMFAR